MVSEVSLLALLFGPWHKYVNEGHVAEEASAPWPGSKEGWGPGVLVGYKGHSPMTSLLPTGLDLWKVLPLPSSAVG